MNRIHDCSVRQDKVLVLLGDNVSKGWRLEQATALEEDLERESKKVRSLKLRVVVGGTRVKRKLKMKSNINLHLRSFTCSRRNAER